MFQKPCTTSVKSSHFCHFGCYSFFDGQRGLFHQFLVIFIVRIFEFRTFLNVSNDFHQPPHKLGSNTGFFIDLKQNKW